MMMSQSLFLIFIISIVVDSSSLTTTAAGVFRLERSYAPNHPISALRAKDHSRRLLLLQAHSDSASSSSVVDIPTSNHSGLYYAKVLLGSPPKEFSVEIDTGSDALWVSCKACTGCYQNNQYYDESVSSTSYLISCSDELCPRALTTCIIDSQAQCTYTLNHSSAAEASGYYVSDVIHLDINGTSPTVQFGCSTSVAQSQGPLDGLFGFGRQSFSVIHQLYSQGVYPYVFSHCLAGSDSESVIGGGVLTIGYPQEPKIEYTPLVPDAINFDVTLESISVNSQTLPVNRSTFQQGRTRFDSGIAMAYIAKGAYLHLLDTITELVMRYSAELIQPAIIDGIQCYLSDGSVDGLFPGVTFNFSGNASMHLRQQDYLVQQQSQGKNEVWCIGFMESTNQDTILGDLVLRDTLVVYDLERQRIGWAGYDCARLINATTAPSSGDATTAPSNGVASEQENLLTHLLIVLYLFFVALY